MDLEGGWRNWKHSVSSFVKEETFPKPILPSVQREYIKKASNLNYSNRG